MSLEENKLEHYFKEACDEVKNIKNVSNQDKLVLYGLFKVSTEGKYQDIRDKEIGFFDFEKKAKYESWKKLSSYDPTEAKIEYIKFSCKLANKELPLELNSSTTENTVSSDYLNLDIPNENIEPFQFSSTAKQTKDEIKEYLENASNNECVFYEIQKAFHDGKKITPQFFDMYKHIDRKLMHK